MISMTSLKVSMKEKVSKFNYYIGLDIGGTKCAQTIGKIAANDELEILKRVEFSTAGQKPDVILGKFSEFIEDALKDYEISGIGISCGGPLDSKRGVIMSPPSLPLWDDIKVVEYFESKFGIKTLLQNDANACAVAEWKFGAGRNTENMVFLTFGTGFGAGLILGGRLYGGTADNAGEIGHIRLTDRGPEGYRKKGSCEGYCSGSGMARLARIMGKRSNLKAQYAEFLDKIGGEENISAKNMAEYARSGNEFCKAVYRKSGEMLGRSIAILVDLLNPQKIVIGGIFMRANDLLMPHAERIMKKECLSFSLSDVEVVPAGLGENIGDYAALSIAKGEF